MEKTDQLLALQSLDLLLRELGKICRLLSVEYALYNRLHHIVFLFAKAFTRHLVFIFGFRKRIVVGLGRLQEVGQQTGKDSDKLYWLVYCAEDEADDYAAAMKSYKQLIPLDVRDGKGLYVVVSQRNALSETVEKLEKKGIAAHFISLDELSGTPDLSGISEADRETLSAMLNGLAIYNFGYDSDQAIRISRGSKGQIAALDGQKTVLRLIRIALIVGLAAAAVVLIVQLKRANRDENKDKLPRRRQIRLLALVAAGVMLAGVLVMSFLINRKNDEIVLVSDLTVATDLATGAVSDEEAAAAEIEAFFKANL